MSRLPQRSSRSPLKPPSTSEPTVKARAKTPVRSPAGTPVRTRTKSAAGRMTPSKPPPVKDEPPPLPTLSIKEAIALKRAEAKKAQKVSGEPGLGSTASLEDAVPTFSPVVAPIEDGRRSTKETIERARSTGTLNLASRTLPCLPSALFEIHLAITPAPLKSVSKEPPLTTGSETPTKRGGSQPAWFEAQDLQVLKAWNNEILEIQSEISMFGSLKTIDLHKNRLESLPDSFGDLTALTTLDLSENSLTSLPTNLFALPELAYLNISHNNLTSIPFNAPFVNGPPGGYSSSDFFAPSINRATSPLPRLVILDVSYNKIASSSIDLVIPSTLFKLNLSHNPLGESRALLSALGSLPNLAELRMSHAGILDDSFPPDLFKEQPFPRLVIFDMEENTLTLEVIKLALTSMTQTLNHDFVNDDPPPGVTRVTVGKKIIREAWELEVERRAKARTRHAEVVEKESWEIEAELSEGAKRRMRAAAAAEATPSPSAKKPEVVAPTPQKTEAQKEAWEIEAEQGLLTEGGKRRARAIAAAAAVEKLQETASLGVGSRTPTSGSGLSNPQYYTSTTRTLKLPASTAPTKSHVRAFSWASGPALSSSSSSGDLTVPTPTLPLAEISHQSFAATLKVLILTNRRMDKSFSLPPTIDYDTPLLPCLEELSLEGCSLPDVIPINNGGSPPHQIEPLLPLIAKLFPSLLTLDLSYNSLTSAALATPELSELILQNTPYRNGLRHLRLRGNRLTELDGLKGVAELFRGNREVPGWKLDELDLRDNEIGKLAPELGLLPLDVFLVDGNVFRVPARRIWEREGTKGLLSWLRGRME